MKITALEVEGFGVWSGLRLDPIPEGLTLFYGPNEAGKTTLVQFIRAVLYGFSPERQGYLPPVHGGRAGGSVWVSGQSGPCVITRHPSLDPARPGEELLIFGPDGSRQGEALLNRLLGDVDEKLFNYVFAVGLRELQELAALEDTQAAALLYNLSVGMATGWLVELMRELAALRSRLLDPSGGPCQIVQLLAERQKLRRELAGLDWLSRRYEALAHQRAGLDREIARLEQQTQQLGRQLRMLELAAALRPQWEKQRLLDQEGSGLELAERMPHEAVGRFERLSAALARRRKQQAELKRQWEGLCQQAAELQLHAALLRNAPRIEALQEQQRWVAALETQVSELETLIGQAEAEYNSEQQRVGLEGQHVPWISPRWRDVLRRPARALHACRKRLEHARRQLQQSEQTARSLAEQIRFSLDARGHRELGEATQQAGGLVAQLRRRTQLDHRLEELDRRRSELREQAEGLIDREMLPVSVIVGLGGVFVAGVVLVMLKLWDLLSETSLLGDLGWPLALLGVLATAAAVLTKWILEQSNARQIEACHRQIRVLEHQMVQTRQEREELDRQLPAGEGPASSRLQSAEQDLAGLEELVPLDAQRQAAQRQAEVAAASVQKAEADLAVATRRWNEAIAAAGLPEGLSPKQVRELAVRVGQMNRSEQTLQQLRQELRKRSEELRALTDRIEQLARDVGFGGQGQSALDRLRLMVEELGRQRARLQRRQALARQARRLRRKYARLAAAVAELRHRRQIILEEAGAGDPEQFRRRAAAWQQAESLRHQRELLSRQIQAAIAGLASQPEIDQILQEHTPASLDQRRQEIQARLAACQSQLHQRLQQRGQLVEALKSLAEDRTPAIKQLQLATVQKRLRDAVGQWQVLSVIGQALQSVRKTYEQTRQPECLQEASAYLCPMTLGRYRRVWTPLGEDVLWVDDAAGKPYRVELLSHGVREQLFLCLRLALAGYYARRGAALPMILDDVLVNFDAQRCRAAAGVLRQFAAAGHQLLVFTCHEHIAELFDQLGVEVKQLPDHAELRPSAGVAPQTRPGPRQRAGRPERVYGVVASQEPAAPAPSGAGGELAEQPAGPPMGNLPGWEEDDSEAAVSSCLGADRDSDTPGQPDAGGAPAAGQPIPTAGSSSRQRGAEAA
ncbi:MAG: AAA family ATPase [Thermoguttaceae bacterium]